MIWVLIIYAMGFLLTKQSLENSLEYNDDSWAALMWPLLVVALVIEWYHRG